MNSYVGCGLSVDWHKYGPLLKFWSYGQKQGNRRRTTRDQQRTILSRWSFNGTFQKTKIMRYNSTNLMLTHVWYKLDRFDVHTRLLKISTRIPRFLLFVPLWLRRYESSTPICTLQLDLPDSYSWALIDLLAMQKTVKF